MDAREAAWRAVHEALPGPLARRTGYVRRRHAWSVTTHGPLSGRGKAPQVATRTGEDEVAALREPDDLLRGAPRPDSGRMEELTRRLRRTFVSGAEADSRRLDRGLTAQEPERVLRHYPGDLAERGNPKA